jgi:hypothetical protein
MREPTALAAPAVAREGDQVSETGPEGKVPGKAAAPCLPFRYPWTARIISPDPVGPFASGSLVQVTGMDNQGRYLIADRAKQATSGVSLPVPAAAGTLDEALSWALDTMVMKAEDVRTNITWDIGLKWLHLTAATNKAIQGTRAVSGPKPGPAVTVAANTPVAIYEWKGGRYLASAAIEDDDFALVEVTSDDLTGLDESVPLASSAKPVAFICHQLAPYVACKSGLRQERDFYRALLTTTTSEAIDFWAAFCDAKLDAKATPRDQVKPGPFARGDLVVFDKYNGFAHVAIATGLTSKNGSPTFYSLWDNRENHPIIDDMLSICAHSAFADPDHPVEAIRTATPAWHLR